MPLIGIIVGIVFLFFLAQAICETVWGICLIINGLFWRMIAGGLYALAFVLHSFEKCSKPQSKRAGCRPPANTKNPRYA